jgi:hypothetical protein
MDRTKKIVSTSFLLVIATALILMNNQTTFETRYSNDSLLEVDSFNQSYIAVNKLVIDGNWSAIALTYSWCTGSGTIGDPYVISGIEVDGLFSGSCLTVKNTNDHFIIENSKFFNGGSDFGNAGIYLENVQNGIVRTTDITGVHEGVYIDTNSASITIANNNWTITGTLTYGAYAIGATGLNISYNEIHGNKVGRHGIHLQETTYSIASHNNLNGTDLHLAYNADNNIIEDNTITGGRITTFSGGGVANNTIRRNTITDCALYSDNYAIWITGSSTRNLITENTISNVQNSTGSPYIGIAILVEGSSTLNNITSNVINNSENGIAVNSGVNNTITGNTVLVYQNCVYGTAINYSAVTGNDCSIIQRPSIPIASFTASSTSVATGEIISFTDTTTAGNSPLSYQWNFGDGSGNVTTQNTTHSYGGSGEFIVTLTVTDSDGDTSTHSVTITVTSPATISSGHFFLVFIPVGIIIIFLFKFKNRIKLERR